MGEADVTAMFRALGDPTRRAIFEFLCERCCPVALEESGEVHPINGATVGEVCCHVTGSEKFSSTVSFHVKELRLSGLINADRNGKFMICSVRQDSVEALVNYLHALPKPDRSCDPNAQRETSKK